MKVLCAITCFMSLQLLFSYNANVSAKPIVAKNTTSNSTCTKNGTLRNNANAIGRDLRALFFMVKSDPNYKCYASTAIFSNFSKFTNLSQNKLIERLYLHHKALKKAFRFLGLKKANQKIGINIFNIIVQIKQLAELLRSNTNCNPGQPGVGFVFNLPKTPPPSSVPFPDFLYNMAVLLKEIFGDFKKNVFEYIKVSLGK